MPRALLWVILGLAAIFSGEAFAQDSGEKGDSGPSYIVNIDLDAFRKSSIGEKILSDARKSAMEELKELGEYEEITKALGLDPFVDIHGLTVIGTSFEHPEKDVQLILSLGNSTGNIEGLIVAVPGYAFTNHRDYRVYSASPDGSVTAYGAIHGDASGRKKIVAAMDKGQVTAMLDALDGRGPSASSLMDTVKMEDGFYLKVQVFKLASIDMPDEFHANIIKLLKSVTVAIGERDGKVAVEIVIAAADEKSSEQMRQLWQGLAAVFPLATMGEPNDDMKKFAKAFLHSKVTREGNDVRVRVEVPTEDVIQFLREEADLKI